MKRKFLGLTTLVALLLVVSACAAAPAPEAPATKPPPPPPQNLLGATDELQLVTELSFEMAKLYGAQNILVALDIDNTLLAMEQGLGSDQWYYWQKSLEAEQPCSEQLVDDLLQAQGALFFASAMRPVQDNAAEQVRRMQDEGIKVIALTSRGPEYRLATFRELRRNGISLWSSAWAPARGYPETFVPEGGTRPALYEDGVFMTAGQDKGVMLKALLDKSGQPYPTLIIVVDDKQEYLNQIMGAFSWSGTAVQAWRYTREDPEVEAFDTEQATTQWEVMQAALLQVEEIMGPDNYDLPDPGTRAECSQP
jgi:hypothetical protein